MNSLMDSSGGATLRGLNNMSNKRALHLPNNIHVIPAFIFFFIIATIAQFLIALKIEHNVSNAIPLLM